VSSLFPPGIDHLADLPHTFHDALMFALMALSWEELPKEERPPRNIWLDSKALNKHFKAVERVRKEKYGGGDPDGIEGPVSENKALDMLVR
jgi:hypothetical protein